LFATRLPASGQRTVTRVLGAAWSGVQFAVTDAEAVNVPVVV
jgi:hypothetical protein